MGRVNGYAEYTASGVAQHERYGIVHDLRGQVIAEKGRTLLAKSGGGFPGSSPGQADTLYTHTVNNYSATGVGANSAPIKSVGAVGSSTGLIFGIPLASRLERNAGDNRLVMIFLRAHGLAYYQNSRAVGDCSAGCDREEVQP
jgi:hypothetical protein